MGDRFTFSLLPSRLHFALDQGATRTQVLKMTQSELDALTRERLESAAYILRNHAALIMYAASRGEDLTTSRRRLLSMLCTGIPEEKSKPKPGEEDDEDSYSAGSGGTIRLEDMSEHEMSE